MTEEHASLARLAARTEDAPFFLGSALAAYRRLEQLDGAALADFLGCDESALARLALCRRPEGGSTVFAREVSRIAEYAGCAPLPLANLLRAVSAAERMRAAGPGALLAARDRISEGGADTNDDPPKPPTRPEQDA